MPQMIYLSISFLSHKMEIFMLKLTRLVLKLNEIIPVIAPNGISRTCASVTVIYILSVLVVCWFVPNL